MSKMSTDLVRHALNGPTMGTRWTALFHATPAFDPDVARVALQAAADEVDAQMSTWKPGSDLMRLNAASPSRWIDVPAHLMIVLKAALAIGRASGGAFDIGVGDAVAAWGFGPEATAPERIRAATASRRQPAHEVIELEAGRVRKREPITLDLNGIAKGYGVDRIAETLASLGIVSGLVGIDGEMLAMGLRPDGEAWTIAVERPDPEARAPHSIIALHDAAVATSGDYRHWVDIGSQRLSHTMDPARGGPLITSPASVTVVARTCAEADAWATALMVKGSQEGAPLASRNNLHALFIDRKDNDLYETGVGWLFEA
ncbi:FAD:protein FMN transferase [Aestuariivirga sp.]|uniref:FAD:protein FMN transferase n=1 Tax=Aestuariivirga sp. TaxID=2650926 RepID=UPI003594068B